MRSVAFLVASLLSTDAFVPATFRPSRSRVVQRMAEDGTDFDAPADRLQNAVRSGEGIALLDHEIVVDDEKSADYDPLHNPVVSKLHSDERTDFDAPMYREKAVGNIVRSGEAGDLDHEPIVDDECYMGKDGDFDDCVDFDPMHP